MNTDRLGKLLKAYRLADEDAVKDDGKERAQHEREIRALIGGGEAEADPWPDAVRAASKAPDMDVAWRLLVDTLTPAPFPATDGDTWIGPWPDREWLIPGWLPVGRLGMLSGRGGRGKSRLALQLAARMAAIPPERGPFVPAACRSGDAPAVFTASLALDATHAGPVAYCSWEDEREEAGRRIAKFGADGLAVPADLAGRLRYLDLRGEGPLWGPVGEARHLAALGELTPVGQRVRATCEALEARLLVVDSLAGAYGLDENVRALVRSFCASWDRWATNARCAVMLIAHPPKTPGGAGAGQVDRDYAGSTDWHGAARWRWTMDTADTGETMTDRNKQLAVQALALSLVKSSYGPSGNRLFLEPSDSKNGWLGVSSKHAAQAALPDGSAMGDTNETQETQGWKVGDPPLN